MRPRVAAALLIGIALAGALLVTGRGDVEATPHPGQSVNVVIIGGTTLDPTCAIAGLPTDANQMNFTGGGCLNIVGPAGELGDFAFTPMAPAAVSAASLAPYDTAVLNVASGGMACNTATLTPAQKADLVSFVGGGKKLIIFDSECFPGPVDYSWMPFPFTTANPGALGGTGTLTIVEDNTLSTLIADPTCVGGDPHCINVSNLGTNTDAVGDMNVMTTFDPNWCLDMSGTNAIGVTGPVHTYAKYPTGTDTGLFIYNGLDQDFQYQGFVNANLKKIWVQELQQPFNPSNLPCGVTVVGITLTPPTDENEVGQDHTVTATLKDLLGVPQPGVLVTFTVLSGPNAGASGTCSVNADCTTDANGEVSFTYTGSGGVGQDEIQACFINPEGEEVCSVVVTKDWVPPPNTPPRPACVESVNPAGSKIPPAGSTTLPGPKGGQNEDGFYKLLSRDAEQGTADIFVSNASGTAVFGPFASGSVVKITEAAINSIKLIGGPTSAVAAHITLDSDAVVYAVDSGGLVSPSVSCLVPEPPK